MKAAIFIDDCAQSVDHWHQADCGHRFACGGLIEDDRDADDGDGGLDPNSVGGEPEILDQAPVVDANVGILIIDDDGQFRTMLHKMLKFAGYANIFEAADGQQGLELFAESHPDLIITDMVMPQKLGSTRSSKFARTFPTPK